MWIIPSNHPLYSLVCLYYKWCLGHYPNDICSFFWTSLLLLILGVFIVPGRWICSFLDSNIKNETVLHVIASCVMYVFSFLLIIIGELALSSFGYEFIYWWSWLFGGFILGVLILGTFSGIGYFISLFLYNLPLTKKETHFVENTMDIIGAIKGKYCTKIDWKD